MWVYESCHLVYTRNSRSSGRPTCGDASGSGPVYSRGLCQGPLLPATNPIWTSPPYVTKPEGSPSVHHRKVVLQGNYRRHSHPEASRRYVYDGKGVWVNLTWNDNDDGVVPLRENYWLLFCIEYKLYLLLAPLGEAEAIAGLSPAEGPKPHMAPFLRPRCHTPCNVGKNYNYLSFYEFRVFSLLSQNHRFALYG
uniref:Uncharacterized protein n=1 Tax=Cacopsylla melanoneura TaxID=428564 RepID=A0A8D8W1F1_9HEMI